VGEQLQHQGTSMGFFMQISTKLENAVQEMKDSMGDMILSLQADVVKLDKKSMTLETSVELTITYKRSTMCLNKL
jgi:hypothetical protein